MVLASKFEHTAARADPGWMATVFFSPRPGQQGHRFFYFPILCPYQPLRVQRTNDLRSLKIRFTTTGRNGPHGDRKDLIYVYCPDSVTLDLPHRSYECAPKAAR